MHCTIRYVHIRRNTLSNSVHEVQMSMNTITIGYVQDRNITMYRKEVHKRDNVQKRLNTELKNVKCTF